MHIRIFSEVHNQIIEFFQKAPIESGGIRGIKNGVICSFAMDDPDKYSCSEYYPNVKKLNKRISEWAHRGISFFGIIHSHPNGQFQLSETDKQYFSKIYRCMHGVDCICCPIVVYNNGEVYIHTYIYNGEWQSVDMLCENGKRS